MRKYVHLCSERGKMQANYLLRPILSVLPLRGQIRANFGLVLVSKKIQNSAT
jgi:hypothetical protein